MKFYIRTEDINEEMYRSFFSFVECNIFIIFFGGKGRFFRKKCGKKSTVRAKLNGLYNPTASLRRIDVVHLKNLTSQVVQITAHEN